MQIYKCETCIYETSNKSNYGKHLTTTKHKKKYSILKKRKEIIKKKEEKSIKKEYVCEPCGKTFTDKSNLYRHKRKFCDANKNEDSSLDNNNIVVGDNNNSLDSLSGKMNEYTNLLQDIEQNMEKIKVINKKINEIKQELKIIDVVKQQLNKFNELKKIIDLDLSKTKKSTNILPHINN
mgnify:FL=1